MLNQPNIQSVTPLWVEVAVNNGFVHNPKYYSPCKPNQFLSGVVLTILDVPELDVQLISNEIKKYGGQIRNDLTEDITHLICIDPRGAQYKHCIDHRIPVVLPQWLDDSLRWMEKLDSRAYQFPTPIVYNPTKPPTLFSYPTLEHLTNNIGQTLIDQIIYFGTEIHIKDDFKSRLVQSIKRAGGTVSTEYNPQVTIVILKYRSTPEAIQAFEDRKWIASLWWLTNTLAREYMLSPLSTLLDYPLPPGGIPGMEHLSISITGYKNIARDFLRRLIIHTGAVFNPLMDSNATHLICGSKKSEKYKETCHRDIKVVNHLWLEETFMLWKVLDCRNERYSYIGEDVLNQMVGRTHLLQNKLDLWMNPQTMPDYLKSKHAYEVINMDEKGSVDIVKPRKAALKAIRVLNSIVMPDANAYEKELRSAHSSSKKNADIASQRKKQKT
ncbi:hypothetical protein G6F46_009945 [Rhizopus delemar]|uniref:BRCT domain-containing protein n=2 Tax=Rhizopus TaxID=4842 RepID=A0A9P6YWL6_9FUNG|nr:hypothetical protein G6F55_009116 [Rhizopus delemar]KAG1538074.1 hypothetical protein G6F51_009994 [Rhizopus arrhizus]KAG1492178.1 hypothetical protein G6F54_009494 [Rhizopus delemar]KAG1506428.1 hypothetical protein G6F53_009693 [Rhizopus delemar]KAG1521215.1 hypothetical protein G6F52_006947 [Rhizopus delemar]